MSSPYLQGQALADAIAAGAELLKSRFGAAPSQAVVLGSGWAAASERLTDVQRISYAELPGWPLPKVEGHVNELVIGTTAWVAFTIKGDATLDVDVTRTLPDDESEQVHSQATGGQDTNKHVPAGVTPAPKGNSQ